MSTVSYKGGPVTIKYLMAKKKTWLASHVMDLLRIIQMQSVDISELKDGCCRGNHFFLSGSDGEASNVCAICNVDRNETA